MRTQKHSERTLQIPGSVWREAFALRRIIFCGAFEASASLVYKGEKPLKGGYEMRIHERAGLFTALVVIMSFIGAWVVSAADAPPASLKGMKLSCAGGGTGSAGFARYVQWAQVMNSKLGTDIAVETTGGAAAAPTLIQRKAADFGTGLMGLIREAYRGEGKYKAKHPDLRAMYPDGLYLVQFYTTTDRNFRDIRDLDGRRVSLSRRGAGVDNYVRRIFPEIGVKPKQIVNLSPSEGTDLLKNNQLDACGLMGYIHPTIVEAAATLGVVVFGIDPALAGQINKVLPTFQELTLPANVYRGQTKPLVTMGDPTIAQTNKDTPEELVYWLVKTTIESADQFAKFEPSMGAALKMPERILKSPIPLHKGAYRYYKEIGLDIPDAIVPRD